MQKVVKGDDLAEAVAWAYNVLGGQGLTPTKVAAKRILAEQFGGLVGKAGNTKVGTDTATFNVSTTYEDGAMSCPEFLAGTCQLSDPERMCYRARDVKRYTNTCGALDRRSAKCFETCEPDVIAAAIILSWWCDAAPKDFPNGQIALRWCRFNVGGGFANLADVLKAQAIAGILASTYGIHSYTYTSRQDLAPSFTADPDLTFTGSGFMIDNAFKVVPKGHVPNGAVVCPGNCTDCHICKLPHHVDVYIELH